MGLSPETFPIFPAAAVSRYFVNLLNELGYDAVLKVVPDEEFKQRVFRSLAGGTDGARWMRADYTAGVGLSPRADDMRLAAQHRPVL